MHLGLFLVQSKSLFQEKLRAAAKEAAQAAGVSIEATFADGDARAQHQQLFDFVRRDPKPDGLLLQPVEGSGVRFVVREAHQRGIGCAFINRHPAFLHELRSETRGVAFSVTPDNTGIGRIQGEQCRALLPQGGTVLCVTGPPGADSVIRRLEGLELSKGSLLSTILVTGNWTESGGEKAVAEWLETTRGFVPFDMVGAQNDDMALGARRALERFAPLLEQPRLRSLPIAGVDGLPEFGRRLVSEGKLQATVLMPPTSGKAVELLVAALREGAPVAEEVTLPVTSHPAVSQLLPIASE